MAKKHKPRKPKVVEKANELRYFASVKVLGKTYTAEGLSPIEAIKSLSVPLGRGMSILSVQCGESKREKILTSVATSRLFGKSNLARELALKAVGQVFTV